MRLAVALALGAALGSGALGCGRGHPSDPRRVERDDAIIYLEAPATAMVWIDGLEAGTVGQLRGGIALEPGPHRLELHQDGFHPHYQDLELVIAERRRLTIELAPVLP